MSFDIQHPEEKLQSSNKREEFFSLETERITALNKAPMRVSTYKTNLSLSKKRYKRNLSILLVFLLVIGCGGWYFFRELITQATIGGEALEQGVRSLQDGDQVGAQQLFERSKVAFTKAQRMTFGWGRIVQFGVNVPGIDRIATGVSLIRGGKALAQVGLIGGDMLRAGDFSALKSQNTQVSYLHAIQRFHPYLVVLEEQIGIADRELKRVNVQFVPVSLQSRLNELRDILHLGKNFLSAYVIRESLISELLGANGPRTYLFLFQNNQELRATGGFIGSYAHLEINQGEIRKFFVDGIFNPDGQLKENIVPPEPIQKISAGWSLHDSNWFPDFPLSAQKAIFFYEKTGGPTVDGVMTFTPTILEHLLEVTGPIFLEKYVLTIDAENFLPLIQTEVEEKYDREENNPKAILSDLMDELLRRLLVFSDINQTKKVIETFVVGLNERQILLFARHPEIEALIDGAGWSGRILETPHDYLSVVHSNVNGYKTDGVIQETISHRVEIQSNGDIEDTVTVMRQHFGGKTPYTWWNKVNADYMRVYVPLGSELISAEGMTPEVVTPPLDYDALGFRRDADIVHEESLIRIDPESGTRIGEDAGKTVFGNWVYVSPGETVSVTYRYRLPIKLVFSQLGDEPRGFSVLYQKQAGTKGVQLKSEVHWPMGVSSVWQSRENLIPYGRSLSFDVPLRENQFLGLVLK